MPIAYRTLTQLGLLKRLHRALKEDAYRRNYDSPADAQACPADFHTRHSAVRRHRAQVSQAGGDPVTPPDAWEGKVRPRLAPLADKGA